MKKSLKLFKADDCEVHGFWRCAFQGARNDHSFDHDSGHDATRLRDVDVTLEILDSLVTAVTFFKGQVSSANGKTTDLFKKSSVTQTQVQMKYSSFGTVEIIWNPWLFSLASLQHAKTDALNTSCGLSGIFLSASCPKASWLKFEETSARANGIGSRGNHIIKGIAVDWVWWGAVWTWKNRFCRPRNPQEGWIVPDHQKGT